MATWAEAQCVYEMNAKAEMLDSQCQADSIRVALKNICNAFL